MTARIVFADGSKQMARNTDDLMFRWHERKSMEPTAIIQQHQRGIAIRDCSNPANFQEAVTWRSELGQQQKVVELQITVLRDAPNGHLATRQIYQLKCATQEIMLQLAALKAYIREHNPTLTEAQIAERSEAKQAKRLERIAAHNQRQYAALVGLYNAVSEARLRGCIENWEDLQGAMAVASEFMPTTNDSAD